MSNADLLPGTLALGVRPPRAAIAVPLTDQLEWKRVFESAIAAQSRVWGGSANLVFPMTDDLTSNELLWSLLDLFDPDLLLTYVGAVSDLQQIDPEIWTQELARVKAELADFDDQIREQLMEEWQGRPLFDGDLDDRFVDLVRRRIAVLHGEAGPSPPWITEFDAPPYPLLDVAQLRQIRMLRPVQDVLTNEGALPQLLLTVEVGRLSSGLRAEIEKLDLPVDRTVLDGYRWRHELFRREARASGLPWTFAEVGLRWGMWRPPRRDAVALVVGSDPWDFTLFYALRRLRSLAYWLPDELHDDQAYVRGLGAALDWAAGSWGGRVAVVSAATFAAREPAIDLIRAVHRHRRPLELGVAEWKDLLPPEPSRLYEQEGEGRPFSIALHGSRAPQLPTPIPRFIWSDDPQNVRWMAEVRVTDWAVIRHSELGPAVIEANGYDTNLVRVGRDGPSYFAPNWLTFAGVGLESMVVRPTLVRRPLREQLEAALAPGEWKVQRSIKGVFAEETATKFGGFRRLVDALRDEAVRSCLAKYVGTSSSLRLEIDQRRYPELRDFARQIGRRRAVSAVADLEERGVLARGVVLKCRRCRSTSWYGLDAISQQFVCRRCELRQAATRERWLEREEPRWRYRLDEVVYQFMKENGDLPVLALDLFLAGTEAPVDVAYELRFISPAGVEAEVDIVAARGYELIMGEATRADRYADRHEQERLTELRTAVEAAETRHVLLATSRPAFHTTTKTRAEATFRGAGAQLSILEGVE